MRVLEVEESSGDTNPVLDVDDPDWVEIVPGTPRRWNDGWLTIEEHGNTRSLLFNGAPLSGSDQWVRSLVDVTDLEILYTASIDPTTIDLWSVRDGRTECLTDGNGVVQAVGSQSVTVIERSSLESSSRVEVITPKNTWGINAWPHGLQRRTSPCSPRPLRRPSRSEGPTSPQHVSGLPMVC